MNISRHSVGKYPSALSVTIDEAVASTRSSKRSIAPTDKTACKGPATEVPEVVAVVELGAEVEREAEVEPEREVDRRRRRREERAMTRTIRTRRSLRRRRANLPLGRRKLR